MQRQRLLNTKYSLDFIMKDDIVNKVNEFIEKVSNYENRQKIVKVLDAGTLPLKKQRVKCILIKQSNRNNLKIIQMTRSSQ